MKQHEKHDPRGYVFVDRDGDAWGYSDGISARAPIDRADRPFRTIEEAAAASRNCGFGFQRIEVWTPECRVPPMPENRPTKRADWRVLAFASYAALAAWLAVIGLASILMGRW